jgi:cation-dependent mannose-6-phosphate receptor
MYISSVQTLALCAFAMQSGLSTAESTEKATPVPCTVHSPNTGLYHDLRPISLTVPDLDKKSSRTARAESWQSRGYDFNANFTINICAPVVEDIKNVVGVEKSQWQNVSAFYIKDEKTYSIG